MFRVFLVKFIEELWYSPKFYHYFLIILLSPISLIYMLLMYIRRVVAKREKFPIPIISIGNLVVGGSGKSPFIIEIASKYDNVAIISRGYGRKSRGTIEVTDKTAVEISGDEALMMAISLPNALVIVSENRKDGIRKAINLGAKVIFLDDGFNRVDIEKLEILLEPKGIKNFFSLPAGAFREFYKTSCDIKLIEGLDYKRVVTIDNPTPSMILITAIANPRRLDEYLPNEVKRRVYFEDHKFFDRDEIVELSRGYDSILVTDKDLVKLKDIDINISIMRLKLDIDKKVLNKIDRYITDYKEY
ncbi:Tetraacyldisaccharide 4'-kinase [hydrothermal vent metagenome]|uniref:tetraacyldisaccharide 4'-kinase n=1 Tax=hydrothermal vent metagenome TaxID=652676 RepID=A0A1W1EKH6_9ZZZZ